MPFLHGYRYLGGAAVLKRQFSRCLKGMLSYFSWLCNVHACDFTLRDLVLIKYLKERQVYFLLPCRLYAGHRIFFCAYHPTHLPHDHIHR